MFKENNYTRRHLLQATVGVGAVGAGAGAATGAYLSDWNPFTGNVFETGAFDLELAAATADSVHDLESVSDDSFEHTTTITIDDLPELDRGNGGVIRVGYRLCETPGWVWVRATARGNLSLGDYLAVQLKERPACGTDAGTVLFDGGLTGLVGFLEDGIRLGDSCATCEAACLDIEWEFDPEESASIELSGESLSLGLNFAAVQCRHTDSTENPWN